MTSPAPAPETAPGRAAAALPKKKKPASVKAVPFFGLDPVAIDTVPNENVARARMHKLLRIVTLETFAIALLSGVFLLAMPFLMPVYQYDAINPQKQGLQMVALTMPNMTNRAILSWATSSVTEIMTVGFGDYEQKISQQRPRFTAEGWTAFRDAFNRQKIGETLKQKQQVVTTVPSNTPVIVAQGVNPKHVYEWHVQMPVIMTYATNNNITKPEKRVIELTIVRVKTEQNASGIGIDSWSLKD